jgi:serine phosphatase RsbU (regulator of sigma subunit)/PAS domain-containing protein
VVAVQRPGEPDLERLSLVVTRQQQDLARTRELVEHTLILERAKGVLIERLGCSPTEAADHLTHLAERAGLTVLDIAAEVGGGPPADGVRTGALRLQRVAASAALATDGTDLADAVFADVLHDAGAVAVGFWLLHPDGLLHLVGQHGFRPLDAARWRVQPPDMATLCRRALALDQPIWLPDGLADDDLAPAAARWPDGARAVLPLRHRRAPVGVMEVCWREPTEFTTGLRTQLVGLAELCAGTLASAEDTEVPGLPPWVVGLLDALLDNVLLARAIRDEHGTVVDFAIDHVFAGTSAVLGRTNNTGTLLQRYPMMSQRGGLFERVRDALATGLPYRADGLIVPTPTGDRLLGPVIDVRAVPLLDGVALSWRRHDQADLADHALRLGRTGGWSENLVTGRTEWTAQMFELLAAPGPVTLREWQSLVSPEDLPALARFTATLLTTGRPVTAEFSVPTGAGTRRVRAIGQPITDSTGSVLAVRGAVQDVSGHEHAEFALSAAQDQLSDVERLVDEQQQLAIRLQHAIIAPAPPPIELPGLQVVVRYRPAGNQHLVGGDWYDALALPSGQALLVVGDIVGHGIDVVTGMISMRNALRGLAMTGASPAELLRWLNDAAHALPEPVIGTVVCAHYDPHSGTLRWARAGHLPPMLVRDGTAELLPLQEGPLLGVISDARYVDSTAELRLGDVLALFTDGLVERRGEHLDHGLDRLLASAKHVDENIDIYANRLLDHIPANRSDDTCLVTVQVV